MPLLVLILMIILGIIAFVALITLVGSLIGVIFTLIVAGLLGLLAERIVPGEYPYGFLGAIFAGLFGSWLGVALLGRIGPTIFNVPIISALIGAIIIAIVYSLITHNLHHERQI